MTTAKLYSLLEKLFVMLLAGTCGFAVTYLRDINSSLDKIRERMGEACEQISAIDSSMKSFTSQMGHHREELDVHEARIDSLEHKKRGG